MSSEVNKIGVIAGGGDLPCEIARKAVEAGRGVHIIGIEGEADDGIEAHPHSWIKWGEIGRLFAILKEQDCRDVIIIGRVKRPDLSQVQLDLGALKLLPFIMKLKTGGDDSILSRIAGLFEKKGHKVCSVPDLLPQLGADLGVMTSASPDKNARRDIETGLAVIKTLGRFDVGQAVVVVNNHVIGVEAAEGTDEMLERCAHLRQWGRKGTSGVLVKTPKPAQDRRIDLPTIGPRTIEMAQKAGLSGIAVAAGDTLISQKQEAVQLANDAKLFLVGVDLTQGG